MTDALRALRITLRKLLRAPALSAVSVGAFALGIGLTGTMFSVTYAALFRGLPFEDPDRIFALHTARPERGIDLGFPSPHDLADWRTRQTSFEDLGGYLPRWLDLSDDERYPERMSAALVTASLFPVLGVRPALGRLPTEEDTREGAAAVALLSHRLWETRYGADPGALGRSIRLNGELHTVIGVMPPGMHFPDQQDLWVPLRWDPATTPRGEGGVLAVGRLAEGATLGRARSEMGAIAAALEREHPETNAGVEARVEPFHSLVFADEEHAFLWTMLGAGVLVLLVSCANVASLLLARALDRSKEIALRAALGARRWRAVGALLLEALALSLVGGALGLALAVLGVRWFNGAIAAVAKPFWIDIRVDVPVVLFLLAAATASALLAGGIPAWKATAVGVGEVLKDESRGASSLRMGKATRATVVMAVTFAFPLLVAAGLMIRSLGGLRGDPGFRAEDVVVADIGLPQRRYPDDPSRQRFWRSLKERIDGRPAVVGSVYASVPPGTGSGRIAIALEGVDYRREEDHPRVRHVVVGPGYFELFGISPLGGRTFGPGDGRNAPAVAVVNRSFAERHFPGLDPLGRTLRFPGIPEEGWRTVVGVVPDLRLNGSDTDTPEGLYLPMEQWEVGYGRLLVVTRGDPLSLAPALREEVARLDGELPVNRIATLEAFHEEEYWFIRVFGWTFTIFGAIALFLAAVGLYGVMSFAVARRTREVGVRMAFGADRGNVVGLMLRHGMAQVLLGLAAGLALAFWATRFLALVLYRVDPRDPWTFAGVAGVLLLTGLLASLAPALRASRLDPCEALRQE